MRSVFNRAAGAGLAASVILAAGLPSGAADMPRSYTAPARTPASAVATGFDWSGFYLGAHAGVQGTYDRVSTPAGELLGDLHIGHAAGLAGGYGGYNFQLGALVLGVEGDFSAVLGGRGISTPQESIVDGIFATGASDPKWIATVAWRIGFAIDNWLIYGKAGGAWMKADYTGTVQNGAGDQIDTETIRDTRSGWLAGAGVELAWTQNIVTRIEYSYMDFGTKRLTYTFSGFNDADFKTQLHTVKVGVAWKFGGAPVTARY